MRALLAGAGFAIVPLVIVLVELATGAPLLFSGMRRLAGTVTDGYAPEGFSLPWAYLWHAEHVLLLVWLASALFDLLDPTHPNGPRRPAAPTWGLLATGLYLGLGGAAALLPAFGVTGRQARRVG